MENEIVQSYINNPTHNQKMQDPDVTHQEGSTLCGNITIYLKIQDNTIIQYSYDGNCSIVTKGAASFLADMIIDQDINTILNRDETLFTSNSFIVSPRRKRSIMMPLIACKNAIHKYQNDGGYVIFDDVVDI